MDTTELLMLFSLTRQEAQLYLALCEQGALSGYEAAKLSGISRSNTYTALASLVEKGAAVITEDTATRYLPVEASEFCECKIRSLREAELLLVRDLPKRRDETEGYVTVSGRGNALNKAISMITTARERIYLSVSAAHLEPFLPYLADAQKRGLKIVVISDGPCRCEGITLHQAPRDWDQLRLIVDSIAVMTGDLTENGSCLYSKKHNLVDLFKQALKNEIRLIELKEL